MPEVLARPWRRRLALWPGIWLAVRFAVLPIGCGDAKPAGTGVVAVKSADGAGHGEDAGAALGVDDAVQTLPTQLPDADPDGMVDLYTPISDTGAPVGDMAVAQQDVGTDTASMDLGDTESEAAILLDSDAVAALDAVASPTDATFAAQDTGAVVADTTADLIVPTETGDAFDAPDVALPGDVSSSCLATPELCDGVDNDCDGATDEGFVWQPPFSLPAASLGEPCGNIECKGGTVVCQTLTKVMCSACPPTVDSTVVLAPPGAQKSSLQATGSFTDVTQLLPTSSLQIDLGGPLIVPFGASGMPIDADADGDVDVWWSDGVSKGVLWVQLTPWQFQAKTLATLLEKPAAVAAMPGPLGPTLILAGFGIAALERQVDGSWKDVSAAMGLAYAMNGPHLQHILPADVNDDGALDLVGSVFSCTPGKKALMVWLSRGAGGFVEATSQMGLLATASPWATMQTDYDGDGLPDLLVLTETCNPNPGVIFYQHQPLATTGALYLMKKSPPLFTAPGKPAGSPMGAAQADLNGDGVLDYLMSEIELGSFVEMGGDPKNIKPDNLLVEFDMSNDLLLSQPDGSRKQAGWQAGVWAPLSKGGNLMVAWSPVFTDLDHDGHIDILLSHGNDFGAWATDDAGKMRPVAWRNNGTQQFVDMSAAWGLPDEHDARAMAMADLDGDGDEDLVLGGQAVAPRILRNDLVHKGADLRVVLQGTTSNPWGLGARLQLQTNLRTIVQEHSVQALSQTIQAPVAHFALQPAEVAQTLTVKWPSGWVQAVAVPTKGKLTVVEPKLVELSSRWSPKGQTPVTVTAWHIDAAGKPVTPPVCSIELAAGAQGQWLGPMTCTANGCTRSWSGAGVQTESSDVVVAHCGAKPLTVRPRIFY